VYTVFVSAVNEAESESAAMTYVGYVRVASSTVYVTPGNAAGGTFPYDTPEKGYGNLKTAVQASLDGYTLLLGEGVHETIDQIPVSTAITIRGLGAKPDDVIVRNTTATPNTYYHRTMELNNANGRIENITIENGCVKNQFGGNLRLVLGVVSNCVIRGGLAVADGNNAAGAGVELAGAGTLTHCVISNNTVQGSSTSGSYAGGAIAVQYNAKNGRVSNCLVAYNTYEPSGDVKAGTAGIRFCGSNDNTQIENNTIVANKVEGSLADDSAGIYCTTWYGRLRNNLVVGNYETGKEKYTAVRMDTEHGTYVGNLTDADVELENVFKDFAKGDFRIGPASPAYNAGTLTGLTLLPSVDLAGSARVMFDKIDVGCYECQRKPGFSVVIR
jgi:parallel beta-helix repeat protein